MYSARSRLEAGLAWLERVAAQLDARQENRARMRALAWSARDYGDALAVIEIRRAEIEGALHGWQREREALWVRAVGEG